MLQMIPALLVAITVVIQCLAVQMSRYRLSRMNASPPHHGLALMSGMLAAAAIILRLYQNDSAVGVLFMTIMTGCMTLMTLTDAASCRLPRPFTIMYLISGSAFRLWQGDWLTGLCSAGFWFLLLLLFRQYTSYRRKTETIGLGDVFLIAGIAIWSPPGDIPGLSQRQQAEPYFICGVTDNDALPENFPLGRFSARHSTHLLFIPVAFGNTGGNDYAKRQR